MLAQVWILNPNQLCLLPKFRSPHMDQTTHDALSNLRWHLLKNVSCQNHCPSFSHGPGCEQLSTSRAWKLFTPFFVTCTGNFVEFDAIFCEEVKYTKVYFKTWDIKKQQKTKHKAIYMAWWIEDFKWEMARSNMSAGKNNVVRYLVMGNTKRFPYTQENIHLFILYYSKLYFYTS